MLTQFQPQKLAGSSNLKCYAVSLYPQYQKHSFEELRVEDYLTRNKIDGNRFGYSVQQNMSQFGSQGPPNQNQTQTQGGWGSSSGTGTGTGGWGTQNQNQGAQTQGGWGSSSGTGTGSGGWGSQNQNQGAQSQGGWGSSSGTGTGSGGWGTQNQNQGAQTQGGWGSQNKNQGAQTQGGWGSSSGTGSGSGGWGSSSGTGSGGWGSQNNNQNQGGWGSQNNNQNQQNIPGNAYSVHPLFGLVQPANQQQSTGQPPQYNAPASTSTQEPPLSNDGSSSSSTNQVQDQTPPPTISFDLSPMDRSKAESPAFSVPKDPFEIPEEGKDLPQSLIPVQSIRKLVRASGNVTNLDAIEQLAEGSEEEITSRLNLLLADSKLPLLHSPMTQEEEDSFSELSFAELTPLRKTTPNHRTPNHRTPSTRWKT